MVIRQFGLMAPGLRCQARACSRADAALLRVAALLPAAAQHRRRLPPWLPAHPASASAQAADLSAALPCPQVGLVLQATHVAVANERKAAVDVTPEAAALFSQFWAAHAGCPLLGRNKVGWPDGPQGRAAWERRRWLRGCAHRAELGGAAASPCLSACPLAPLLRSTDCGQRVPRAARPVLCQACHAAGACRRGGGGCWPAVDTGAARRVLRLPPTQPPPPPASAPDLPRAQMLIGGVPRREPGGMHIRGEVHMLLVGDPGTGGCIRAAGREHGGHGAGLGFGQGDMTE